MQLSMRTDYALRAVFTLAEHYGGPPIPIVELARRNDIPKRFLEQIMLDLKKGRWVKSCPGKSGGYVLAKSPARITMGEIIRHFNGSLAPIHCVSLTHYKHCSQESVCRFRHVMRDVRNLVALLLDRATIAEVIRTAPLAYEDRLGMEGDGI